MVKIWQFNVCQFVCVEVWFFMSLVPELSACSPESVILLRGQILCGEKFVLDYFKCFS